LTEDRNEVKKIQLFKRCEKKWFKFITHHKQQQSVEDYRSTGDQLNKSFMSGGPRMSKSDIIAESGKNVASMQSLEEYHDFPKLNETVQQET
jgi:hypothetical protein